MIKPKIAALLGILAVGASAHATWYTDEASFVAAIQSNYYLENFNMFTSTQRITTSSPWNAPGANGFDWSANAPDGLFSNYNGSNGGGALSTADANPVTMTLTFSGSSVTAFGGLLSSVNAAGNIVASNVTLTLSDGESDTVSNANGSQAFLGWVGSGPITTVAITGTPNGDYLNVDHVYTGAATPAPEPASLIAISVGAAALLRRRARS